MAIFQSFAVVGVALLVVQNGGVSATFLAPAQDIVLPPSDSATSPLEHLGGNSPWFAGPDINGVSNKVPEGCVVEQVAYVSRHGSRYPDNGAYNEWKALYTKIQNASFTATGSMAFLHEWKPVLTNPTLQIAQESTTGYKEAFDLGYTLRTRYPDLYLYGQSFMAWANLYPRVVQTAQNFVRGFLGNTATALGTVITVNSTGSVNALFDSLGPSDQCPLYVDGNGGTAATKWAAIYLPPITARLQALITGNLTLATSDVNIMPYLCGFESQITGSLSPWCSVFTDAELAQYEYAQDLRYYYGSGPGTDLPSKMMLPFANSLVSLLAQGPGTTGTFANGTTYTVPNIIAAFTNDGQMTQLNSAIGVWDNTTSLGDGTAMPASYNYRASHFVTMRGTVAFERLNCKVATPVQRDVQHEARFVTETTKKTVTVTICPTETPFATSKAVLPVSSAKAGDVTQYTMSTILSTHTYTITSCAAAVTDCPVGKVTKTVYTSTTWCPVADAAEATSAPAVSVTSVAAPQMTTSTILSTSVYTITSCPPTAVNCPIGKITSTVFTTTTVCPVSAVETGSASSGSGSGIRGSGSVSATSGSGFGTGSGLGSSATSGTAVSGSSPTGSGASATATASSISSSAGTGAGSTTISLSSSSYATLYPNATTSTTFTNNTSSSTSASATATSTSGTTNHTYIRILLNDAVYPLPGCQNGPGKTCLLAEYAAFMSARLAAAGSLPSRCNVTAKGAPTTVKGASFFTDLSAPGIASVLP